MQRLPPIPPLFPYTTLFRSDPGAAGTGLVELVDDLRGRPVRPTRRSARSEEHTSELQSRVELVCRLLLEKNKWPCTNKAILGRLPAADLAFIPVLPTRDAWI